jgi:hypothetical protein
MARPAIFGEVKAKGRTGPCDRAEECTEREIKRRMKKW